MSQQKRIHMYRINGARRGAAWVWLVPSLEAEPDEVRPSVLRVLHRKFRTEYFLYQFHLALVRSPGLYLCDQLAE